MESRWNEAEAGALPDLEGLVYASRLVGADERLVLWGGGNTSAKVEDTDHRGRRVTVLRVKGSGSDLKTIRAEQFPGVRLEDALATRERGMMGDAEMVDYLLKTLMEPGSPRPSIETLLHAFLPAKSVIHSHADAILMLTNTSRGPKLVREALGEGAAWVGYRRPGFLLSKEVGEAYDAQSGATCVVLAKHGLVTWGETAREAYEAHLAAVSRVEAYVGRAQRGQGGEPGSSPMDAGDRRKAYLSVAPPLRGLAARTRVDGQVAAAWSAGQPLEVGPQGRVVLRFDDSPEVVEFVSRPEAAQLSQVGPATPDHLLSVRRTAVFVPTGTEEGLAERLESACRAWTADYVRYVAQGGDLGGTEKTAVPAELDARPRVVLLEGVGMVTLGKDPRAARVAADIYRHAMAVMRGAEAVDRYESLSERECFDVEYWPLELYRQSLQPREADLSRKVAVVTGAASGIGRAIAQRFAKEGACVVVSDVNAEGARAVAEGIVKESGDGRAISVRTDVADEADVARLLEETVAAYGGLDVLVSNAGIAPFGLLDEMNPEDWRRSLDVNATGHFFALREALRLFKRQGIGGNVVAITTKNVMAPGREFGAYSAAKAAQAQLARIAALEGGEFGVRANMINPDAIFRGSTLWSPELRKARAEAHGTDEAGLEDYYRRRNLLGQAIYPEDVAEAAWWLASDRSRKTTGTVITVDGGVAAAFPR
ncbi:MAG TPA: bifunctional rhamnulose-1-phosphate aldolase/short-chain dehydrogenase [Chloroflexota bacterium]|nr:bifunctional rhamnulose-1-phosphate aldolase/short-chain dehydrogenase [Chloroflexota bacterium]